MKYLKVLVLTILFVSGVMKTAEAASSDDYYKAGAKLYAAQNYAMAVKYFGAAVKLDPNSNKALQGRGNCYYALGQYQNALDDYQRVLAANPSNASLAAFVEKVKAKAGVSGGSAVPPAASSDAFNQGVAFYQQKQYSSAIASFQQAVQQNPSDSKAYYCLGVAQVMTGDTKNAALALAISNKLNPNPSVMAYVNKLKSGLSPDDQQWVDNQTYASGTGNAYRSASKPAKASTFGIRLEPALALLSLADFTTEASTALKNEQQNQVYDSSIGFTAVVPQGSANIAVEPVLRVMPNLELGLSIAMMPVGAFTETLSSTNAAVTQVYSYDISSFMVGFNARYFLMPGSFQPYVGLGALVAPMSMNFTDTYTSHGVSVNYGTGSFSGMGMGGKLQAGVDIQVMEGFTASLFGGFQFASSNALQGTVNGTGASATGTLEMTKGTNGEYLSFLQNGATASANTRPFVLDLGGPIVGLQLSAYF